MHKIIDIQKSIKPWGELPFKVCLSFKAIFKYWEKEAASPKPGVAARAQELLDKMSEYPEMRQPIKNLDIVKNHLELVEELLSPLFAEPLQDNEIKAAFVPFTNFFFNPTRRFCKILEKAGDDFQLSIRYSVSDNFYLFACAFIMKANYGLELDLKRNYFIDIPDKAERHINHYRILVNGDFAELEPVDPNFSISKKDMRRLQNNAHDIEVWKAIIPPNSFVLKGFGLVNLIDVTKETVISELKSQLLQPESIFSQSDMSVLLQKLKRIMDMPDLAFGFMFFDKKDKLLNRTGNQNIGSLILWENETQCELQEAFCQLGQKNIVTERAIVYANVEDYPEEEYAHAIRLLKKGMKSYAAIPLYIDKQFTGVLEFGSPHIGEINTITINKLEDIIPIFAVTLQRVMAEQETRLEAIIQENFTSIHPSVAWKFFEIAEAIWQAKQSGTEPTIDDLVFENVMPLYGQSDIKSSSTERNKAVQADLITQLDLASDILEAASEREPLVLYQQLLHRLTVAREDLANGMHAGDEVSISNFLSKEVYPAFEHIRTLGHEMNEQVERYAQRLDQETGNIYEARKDFEHSVAMINDRLGNYLEVAQDNAQQIYPHYFEKYKTDGVEHNIYIGNSLVNQPYHDIYLQNLQLWQFQTICGMERLVHNMQDEMPLKLQVASLILVHGSPITVKFKISSKVFDVDGAYDIRYEIIKKRIDKAKIKGTDERLTQVGKVAIVYSQEHDAETYRRYIDYLISIGELEPEVEELALEDLQGVVGLSALRVTVKMK